MNSVADVVYIVSDALCFTRYSLLPMIYKASALTWKMTISETFLHMRTICNVQQTHVHEQHHAGMHVAYHCQLDACCWSRLIKPSLADKPNMDLTAA